MSGFKLPRGYSRIPPDAEASILVDDRGLYGGADISDHYDAQHNHVVLCCATGPGDPAFRLRGFRRAADGVKYAEVPLAIEPPGMVITGRGNSDIQWIDGTLHFAGWRDKEFFLGTIPSFVPFPSIPSLDQRIKALENAPPPDVGSPPFAASVAYLPQPIPGGSFVLLCSVTLPAAGVYAITLGVRWQGCGQVRLLIDGRMIARTDEGRAYQTLSTTRPLPAGELVADCYGGGAVEWEDDWTGLRVVGLT